MTLEVIGSTKFVRVKCAHCGKEIVGRWTVYKNLKYCSVKCSARDKKIDRDIEMKNMLEHLKFTLRYFDGGE